MISLFSFFRKKNASEPDSISDSAPSCFDARFDVILEDPGRNKIGVIKVAREATGVSLAEAKAIVESVPTTIKTGLPKNDADKLKKKLEAVGAKVSLK